MNNKTLIIIIVALVVLFGAAVAVAKYYNSRAVVASSDQYSMNTTPTPSPTDTPTPSATVSPTPTPASGSCVRDFDQNKLSTAKVSIVNRTVQFSVKNFGTIQFTLYDKDAPKAVENFLRLVNSGYYDCLTFHRVSQGFVIQGGDPNGNGSGGQSAFGSPFADELNASTPSYQAGYLKGVLAMANSGPNTNGSQFFIIFGKVSSGLSVVDAIGQVPITPVMAANDGSPVTPVVITKATIIK